MKFYSIVPRNGHGAGQAAAVGTGQQNSEEQDHSEDAFEQSVVRDLLYRYRLHEEYR